MRHGRRVLSPAGFSLRVIYVAVCLGVLAWYWINQFEPEAGTVFGWLTMLVTMPVGFVGGWIVGSLSAAIGATGWVQVLSLWTSCTILGYLQWFVLGQWIWRNRHRELERHSRAA